MAAAAPYSNLCAMLVDRFLFEGVLVDPKGDQVLHHCFATMRYEDTKVSSYYMHTAQVDICAPPGADFPFCSSSMYVCIDAGARRPRWRHD